MPPAISWVYCERNIADPHSSGQRQLCFCNTFILVGLYQQLNNTMDLNVQLYQHLYLPGITANSSKCKPTQIIVLLFQPKTILRPMRYQSACQRPRDLLYWQQRNRLIEQCRQSLGQKFSRNNGRKVSLHQWDVVQSAIPWKRQSFGSLQQERASIKLGFQLQIGQCGSDRTTSCSCVQCSNKSGATLPKQNTLKDATITLLN